MRPKLERRIIAVLFDMMRETAKGGVLFAQAVVEAFRVGANGMRAIDKEDDKAKGGGSP